jgi:hypothetical protein
MTKDNRKVPRLECTGTASMLVTPGAAECLARIVDLSARGCLLVFQEPLTLEKSALVELTFSVKNVPFRERRQNQFDQRPGSVLNFLN